ncbi:MAG: hypothetical protein ACK416_01690 [Zestosphaera sp.]
MIFSTAMLGAAPLMLFSIFIGLPGTGVSRILLNLVKNLRNLGETCR